jgi:Uma2 family endonuclease
MDTLAPATVKLTIAEFEAFLEAQPDGRPYYELHDGDVIEMPHPSNHHQRIIIQLIRLLSSFLDAQSLGEVLHEREVVIPERDSYYVVDLGVYTFTRFPAGDANLNKLSPDIAVEVYSPLNTYEELTGKAFDYISAGSRLVWVIYPGRKHIYVHYPNQQIVRVLADGVLDGGEVLPGFTLNMSEFWAKVK